MRKLAFQATGMALRGERIPPPFSDEFKEITRSSTSWMDRLRQSKALQQEIILELERTYFRVTVAVETDRLPALGKAAIPPSVIQVFQGPGGQILYLKYTGTETLTNVVLLSLVRQTRGGDAGGIPVEAIDRFNRAFGATEEQANDAKRYLTAY